MRGNQNNRQALKLKQEEQQKREKAEKRKIKIKNNLKDYKIFYHFWEDWSQKFTYCDYEPSLTGLVETPGKRKANWNTRV